MDFVDLGVYHPLTSPQSPTRNYHKQCSKATTVSPVSPISLQPPSFEVRDDLFEDHSITTTKKWGIFKFQVVSLSDSDDIVDDERETA